MVVNKKAKGHRAEKQLADALIAKGYKVQIAQRTSVFTGKFYVSKDNDFFNLFDLIALDRIETMFIQVKTNVNHVYGVKKRIKEFSDDIKNTDVSLVIALKVSRKGWVFWQYFYGSRRWAKFYYDLKLKEIEPFKYS